MEIILYTIAGIFFMKLVKEMKKQNFNFLTEVATLTIAIFKATFSMLNEIIK